MISPFPSVTVFNIDQCDGLPDEIAASVIPPLPGQVEPHGKFCNRMKPGFRMRVLAHGRLA
jgi:hypothetical protein